VYAVSVKVYIVALDYQTRLVDDYGNLRIRLQVTGARCLLGDIYAIKSDKTAEEIKDYFRKALKPYDKILVVLATEWASRRALFDLKKF
jgi:hypothetical protein